MQKLTATLLIAALLGLSACASTSMRRSFKETWNDNAVKSAIRVDLAKADAVKSRHVEVEVYRGVVTLHGRSEDSTQREQIGQIASRTPGVVMVENHIVVKDLDDPRFMSPNPDVPSVQDEVFGDTEVTVASSPRSAPVIGARKSEREVKYTERAMLPPSNTVEVVKTAEAPAVASRTTENKPFKRKSVFKKKKKDESAPILVQDSAVSDLANEAAAELKRLKSMD